MSARTPNPPPMSGIVLALVCLGTLTITIAIFGRMGSEAPVWPWVQVGGGIVQFTGWVLYGRRLRRRRAVRHGR
ncbi:hypothetical protein G6045_26600 [Streptomyces sp. YC504]|uniref:DUF2530 domain-containing protein n=1 Tax=Streptomyces mesophilus TaxID=1775132 RepID=A0A6G4XNR7_9ACTN|nr:hypothetical protein [Streptomyces mesophilus]NGO79195.1 hypothetical protein [Streptomyces mesophilus]